MMMAIFDTPHTIWAVPAGDHPSSDRTYRGRVTEDQDYIQRLAADNPTGWYEQLYSAAADGTVTVPWDRGAAHPLLVEWTAGRSGAGGRALVVGCGLGADAEHLASLGYEVTAFDVSETAIATVRARYPDSPVRYRTADLLDPPVEWTRAYPLVLECFTVQAMPPSAHRAAIANVARFVAPGGTLLLIASAREPGGPVGAPPWPLTPDEVDAYADGLDQVRVERLPHPDLPGRTRWRVELRRPA
jgi:SAM-dependent methyltransferase